MQNKNNVLYLFLYFLKFLLLAANTALFAGVWFVYYYHQVPFRLHAAFSVGILAAYFILFGLLAKLYEGFNLSYTRTSELIYSNSLAALVTDGIFFFVIWILCGKFPNPFPGLLTLAIQCVFCTLWSIVAHQADVRLFPSRKTVVVYQNETARKNGVSIIESSYMRFSLCGEISALLDNDYIFREIEKSNAENVMLCGIPSTKRNDLLKWCILNNINVLNRPNIADFITYNGTVCQMNSLPVMFCHRAKPGIVYAVIKRFFDIVISAFGLIITSPITLITALLIKAYDGGSVFYCQQRLTKDGKVFNIVKFRSMRQDAEKDGVARLATENDDRITPIGKFIRATRIDEIPQLLLVLNGKMSICGPRPERPEIAQQYESEMPEFALRLQVKAGLTGLAQVWGKYNTEPYDKLQMDLIYICKQNIITDLKILLITVKIIFMPESTQGIADGQTTAQAAENASIKEFAENKGR